MSRNQNNAQNWVTNSQIDGHNFQIGSAAGDVNITVIAGPGDAGCTYPRSYIADQLMRECSKRRDILRAVTGLTPSQIELSREFDLKNIDEMLSVRPGDVVALVAPMGAGKSDVANLWLSNRCSDFSQIEGEPLPLWAPSKNISGDLESWVTSRVQGPILSEVGVCLVLDGVDETSKGPQLVEECELLAARWPKSRILITGRPGAIPDRVAQVALQSWSEETSFEMIRKVTGSSHLYPYSYAPQIRDAVRRPLFAMLVASLYGTNGSTPRTSSGLIRHCAMRSLERSIGSWRESFPLLRKIAASSIMNDGSVSLAEFGGEAMRDKLQETRLVSISSHKVSFTLSLFEQWFAAEALLQKEVKLENIIADLVTFSKWRYVLALSVQTGSEAQIDEIITKLAAWNPGASAWVVKEGIERPFVAGSSSSELPSWKVVATRLHRTMGAWGAGLGLLAPIATPVDAGKNIADHVRLHLSVEETGKRFNYAWEVKERDSQGVSHLSKPQDLIARGIGPGSSPSLSGDGWVWSWTLHSMQQRIGVNLLNTLHLHVPLDGVIETEHIWAVVYSILRRGSFLRADPLEASALDGLVRKLQQDAFAFGPVDSYAYRFGRRDVTRLDLLLIREWLSRQTESVLTPPWPAADVSRPPSGWVWNFYTPERLLELTRHVYSRALDAYSEMSRTLFSRFGFTLGHATLMPATLKGQLRMGEGNGFSDGPVLEYSLIPLADSEAIENIVDITLASSNGPRFFQEDDINSAYFRRYYLDNPERAPFSWHGVTSTALHIWESRPATRIAFQWLWADLKALGWVTGLPSDVK